MIFSCSSTEEKNQIVLHVTWVGLGWRVSSVKRKKYQILYLFDFIVLLKKLFALYV